jgi:hypothetical protein
MSTLLHALHACFSWERESHHGCAMTGEMLHRDA